MLGEKTDFWFFHLKTKYFNVSFFMKTPIQASASTGKPIWNYNCDAKSFNPYYYVNS